MKIEEIFELLDDYSRATHMPVSCFKGHELVKEQWIFKSILIFNAAFGLPSAGTSAGLVQHFTGIYVYGWSDHC